MDRYFATKAALFTPDHAKAAVVNRDDEYARPLAATARIPAWTTRRTTRMRICTPIEVRCGADGTDFSLHTPDGYSRSSPPFLFRTAPGGNTLTTLTSLAATGADVSGAAAGLETSARRPRPPRRYAGQDFLASWTTCTTRRARKSCCRFCAR